MNNKEELMPDERLMSRVLHSKRLHNKAKLVIFSKLDDLEEERKKVGPRDMHEAQIDFNELQDIIFKLIIREDPNEAKRLGLIAGQSQEDDMVCFG